MSERKFRVVGSGSVRYESGIGPRQTYHNHENYPVEVTVRRVPEKVTFLVENGSKEFMVSRVVSAVAGCGYGDVRRFRVTVEPLP